MLRLSKKTDYALILLSYLHDEVIPLSANDLSERSGLPAPMVANILKELGSSGLIQSSRGQNGGYLLTKAPHEISVAEVLRIIDQPFSLVECAHEPCQCEMQPQCPTRHPLLALHTEIQSFLEKFTLDQIVTHPDFHSQKRFPHETAYLS